MFLEPLPDLIKRHGEQLSLLSLPFLKLPWEQKEKWQAEFVQYVQDVLSGGFSRLPA